MSSGAKIQQQYYTRAREGIFRSNEGLDTVAKSAGLDNHFIKKALHPFCVYNTPQELIKRGEPDISRYPESLIMFPAETGELVIGRSAFAGSDFTGQRDTIFAHNYIIPRERRDEYLLAPESIFRITGFQGRYDAEIGKALPELDAIGHEGAPDAAERNRVLDELGIDEGLFKQLLFAVMMSISTNKKVFIVLDVDVSESSNYAKRLLEVLFACLPYALRRSFGFITYHNEPQGKKYIDVMFVEKGSIRPGDRSTEKDYVFDFPNRRFLNADSFGQQPYYLDFAWEKKDRPDELQAFYEFAEEALAGTDSQRSLALMSYYQLCALYLIEQGDLDIYKSNKEGIVDAIMGYLAGADIERKPRLSELQKQLFRSEIMSFNGGGSSTLEYLRTAIEYYRIRGNDFLPLVSTLLTHSLINYKDSPNASAYTAQVFQSVLKDPDLYRYVIRQMLDHVRSYAIVQEYALERLGAVKSVQEWQDEILFWVDHSPDLVAGPEYRQLCTRKIPDLLGTDKSKRIDNGKMLFTFAANMGKNGNTLTTLCLELEHQAIKSVLGVIAVGKLTAAEVDKLDFIRDNHTLALEDSLEPQELEKLKALSAVYAVKDKNQDKSTDGFKAFDRLGPNELTEAQELLRTLLIGGITHDNYDRILLAFYKKQLVNGNDLEDQRNFDYGRMLRFIAKEAGAIGTVNDFLIWSAGKKHFQQGRDIRGAYRQALSQYFENEDTSSLKNRKIRKLLTNTKNKKFNAMIKEIRLEQANPIVRFAATHTNLVAITAISIAGLAIVGGGLWLIIHFAGGDKPAQAPEATAAPTVSASSEPSSASSSPTLAPSSASAAP